MTTTGGIFYVYEHWRPDRDECFYVGKGAGRRATVMYSRNRRHQEIQRQLAAQGMCVEIRMVAEGLDETTAFGIECERISFWIGNGVALCNLTAGGEGGSDPSEETRELMRQAKLGRKLTAEHKRKIGDASKRSQNEPAVQQKRAEAMAKVFVSPEYKAKQSASQKARVRTKEHYAKVSAALTGRKLSPEHVEKVRAGLTGRTVPREVVEKQRAANAGRVRSEESKARMRASWTPAKRAKYAAMRAERNLAKTASAPTEDDGKVYLWPWDEDGK